MRNQLTPTEEFFNAYARLVGGAAEPETETPVTNRRQEALAFGLKVGQLAYSLLRPGVVNQTRR